MIIILSKPEDAHAGAVARLLERRGADHLWFDDAEFPERATVSWAVSAEGRPTATLDVQGRRVALDRVSAIWLRRPSSAKPHAEIEAPTARELVTTECTRFLEDVWHSLSCRWVPAISSVVRRASLKLTQLQIAGAVGFELPPTRVTNDPEELLAFYEEHGGNIVSKVVSPSIGWALSDFGVLRYTQQVTRRDLRHADAVRYAPLIFQAYVPKRIELRVTVVGDQVFACEIHSQHSNRTRIDWRRYDLSHTPHHPHALPEDMQRKCAELTRRLGLCYGAIDLVLTPDGRYVFLEINPSGQYLWIEERTALPISEAMADLLASYERGPAADRVA